MFKDNGDFYPTPRPVARDMWRELSSDAKYILEPNAGMGHLADVLKQPYTYDEAEEAVRREFTDDGIKYDNDKHYRRVRHLAGEDHNYGGPKVEIDVIESEPNFCHVLAGKGYPIVGFDWLTYNGVSYYDAIVMNPPFANGDEHLLKAWDFLYKGEIVCLLNAETIRNPCTETRKRLARVIAENESRVTDIGKAFSTAERQTDVEVVRVYLKKNPPDDSASLWASESKGAENNPDIEGEPDLNFPAIRDNLANIQRWYEMANQHFIKGFEELRKGFLYLQQNKIGEYGDREQKSYKEIAGQALSNSHGARADFLRKHRRDAWESIFRQMEFHRWLDSKQQERMLRDVARDMHLPFTVENIKATLENVFLSRRKLFEESVSNVFDELCGHAFENGSGPELPDSLKHHWRSKEGWKTNDTYKVNERLVFPRGCRYGEYGSGFKMAWGDSDRIYTDLDRILCVLDGRPFDGCFTIGHALSQAFDRYSITGRTTADSQYFEIRFFKKGTVHLKWKRKDLLESFNKTAAAGKKWLGADTSFKKAAWREKPDYYCEHHGHDYRDGVCARCERPEVDPLAVIECFYCRTVAEYTGKQVCPLHPEVESLPGGNSLLLLESTAAA